MAGGDDDLQLTPILNNSRDCFETEAVVTPPKKAEAFTPKTGASVNSSGHPHLHHGATPSPALLNPISDEEWGSRRKPLLYPRLSLVDSFDTSGSQWRVDWLDDYERKKVLLNSDKTKNLLRLTTIPTGDSRDADDSGDDKETTKHELTECATIELSNILRFYKPNRTPHSFLIILKNPTPEGRIQYDLMCSSPNQRDRIITSLEHWINPRRSPINLPQRPRSDFTAPKVERISSTRSCSTSDIVEETPKLLSLPLFEEPLSPARSVSIVETEASTLCYSPIDEGMELTLIDVGGEPAILSSPTSDCQSRVVSPVNDGIDLPQLPLSPKSEEKEAYAALISFQEFMDIGPSWISCSSLRLSDISTAFDELFDVTPAKQDEVEPCIEEVLSAVDEMVVSRPFETKNGPPGMSPTRSKPKIAARSASVNSQASRWSALRNEITFDAIANGKHMHHIQTTQSYDELELDDSSTRQSFRQLTTVRSFTSLSDLFQIQEDVINFQKKKPAKVCYDSDPESARPSRRSVRCVRQAAAQQLNHPERKKKPPTIKFPRGVLRNRQSSMTDENVLAVVEVMKSATLHLLWHPANEAPKCVHGWIERGTYLMNQSFVQPKFMWKPAFEPDLARGRKLNLDLMERFDLLEISRIDDNPQIDKDLYPLAKQPHCFVIHTRNSYHVFQARTIIEKIKIVFGLKISVARLASLLMVRDMSAVDEFFEPVDAGVPGRSPFSDMLSDQ